MSTSDGSVIGTTRIVHHGSSSRLWDLVILGDGYRASEMTQYHTDVQNFVDHLHATAPFNDLWCGINIHRVDVASTDSGADEPATCGDGTTGSGATRATYFDSTFCVNNTRRLLAGNSTTALAVSAARVPQGNATIVIVNSSIYGGAGGDIAWFSTHSDAGEIAIHELGHSYFGLEDEYGDIINRYMGSEPSAANATIDTNRATIKWRSLILPATALPTTNNPDCTREGPATSPVPAGTVGAFEGAARAHCSVYRPEFDCKMRTLGTPFCAVCQQRIRQLLSVPEGNFVDCASIRLRRVSGDRFVSTKVIHAIDTRLPPRAETASDVFIRSSSVGFLRAELESAITVVRNVEVNE
jgi:hypothetical protein